MFSKLNDKFKVESERDIDTAIISTDKAVGVEARWLDYISSLYDLCTIDIFKMSVSANAVVADSLKVQIFCNGKFSDKYIDFKNKKLFLYNSSEFYIGYDFLTFRGVYLLSNTQKPSKSKSKFKSDIFERAMFIGDYAQLINYGFYFSSENKKIYWVFSYSMENKGFDAKSPYGQYDLVIAFLKNGEIRKLFLDVTLLDSIEEVSMDTQGVFSDTCSINGREVDSIDDITDRLPKIFNACKIDRRLVL